MRRRPFDEAALDVRKHRLDPLDRLGLLAVEGLAKLALAPVHAVAQLGQRLTALERVRLEVGAGVRDRLLGRLLELLPEAQERRAVLLALGLEPLGVGGESSLRLLDQPSLPAREQLQLLVEVRLRALEVLAPVGEPLLDASLSLG